MVQRGYETTFHSRPDLYYRDDPEEWKELTEAVWGLWPHIRKGYRLLSRFRRKNRGFYLGSILYTVCR